MPFRGRWVLVVEDDHEYRDVLRIQLQDLGASVMVAADGVEGLIQLERRRPDVVFCDLLMPIMDGFEFAQRMRQGPQNRGVLLIAVTAQNSDLAVRDTWAAGFDGHLVKPVTAAMLAAMARRLAGETRQAEWDTYSSSPAAE